MRLRHGLFICLVGCGSSSASPTGVLDAAAAPLDASASDAAPSDTAPSDDGGMKEAAVTEEAASGDAGTDAAPSCNAIANGAPVVNITQVAMDPPTPQGGTIVDGTYWATAVEIYTGPSGPTGVTSTSQMTTLITGTTVQIVSDGQPARRTVTLTTAADAGFVSVDTCPDSNSSQGAYTATPTTLTIFLAGGTDDAGARTVVETLTKQ